MDDVRGRESGFGLDRQGVCWREWTVPDKWRGIDGEGFKSLGHEEIERSYLRQMEEFIKTELELEGGARVDRVKVFDYKVCGARSALPFPVFQR